MKKPGETGNPKNTCPTQKGWPLHADQTVGWAQGGTDLVLGELLHEPPQFEMLTQCMEVN